MRLSIRWKITLGTILIVACSLAVAELLVGYSLVLALSVAFSVAVTLSIGLAHSITTPLSDLSHMVQQLAAGQPTVPIKIPAPDEIGRLVSTLNDAADQLHAQIDALSKDRAQLLAILASMVEGVMVLDPRGYVLQINLALEHMFDVTGTEAQGRPAAELFRHQQLNELIDTALGSRANHDAEIILPLTGRCLHIEVSAAGGKRDNEVCVVLVFHDMTELRRLETIRKDFVANVSHELRTPLTSIKGYVEALLDGAKDDPATTGNFLDIILNQSNRLNLILDDLLELSKIESGNVHFKQEPVNLSSLIDRTIAMMKTLADKKRHQLISSVNQALPPVEGDEERLVQVLTNLLDNAVKYTPVGGTITVDARFAPASADKMIDLSVADTGIGIPEPDRPRVFERFYRADKARSRELGGTGLGLAIVKHLVEGLSGQVWVEAAHPHGSRFVVRLPVSSTHAAANSG